MIKVKCFPVGALSANCYFVTADNDESLLIDTGAPAKELDRIINEFGADKLKYILLTHGHFDHFANTAAVKREYPNVKIVISEKEKDFTTRDNLNLSLFFDGTIEHFDADILVNDGDELPFGKYKIKVLATPGHTIGGVCYIIDDSIFTGDTLIAGTTGRTDFPTGSIADMRKSIARLAAIEGDLNVYCGHGESTRLGYERDNNYFMEKVRYDNIY